MKKIFFQGLYGANSIEFVKGLIHVYPFGLIGKKFEGEVHLHAHSNLYQIFIVESGKTVLHYQNNDYEISEKTFITVPKNTAHGFLHQTDVTGWIISLSDLAVEHLLQREPDVVLEIDAIHIATIDTNDPLLASIYETIKRCVFEYQNELPGRLLMLQNLVGQLIVELYRIPTDKRKVIRFSDNASKLYFRRFQQLIKTAHSFKKPIEEYASELAISPGHLNRICHTVSNQSSKDIVIAYFISQAEQALVNVDHSITEISYQLSFEDPAYFTRLFKKRTGLTPRAFRQKLGIKN